MKELLLYVINEVIKIIEAYKPLYYDVIFKAIFINKENEIILDACSAPGGKTTHLAEIMENKGEIIAWDIYEHRINLIKQNAKDTSSA